MCSTSTSTIVHHLPMWWSIQLTLEPNNHHPSSIICYLSPITHHTTSQTPSNVTHKLSMINNQPSAPINHIPASSSPISFHSSLSTFCHSPMTNQWSPIIHFQWTYHSYSYFNYYQAPISRHSTPIIDYPLPIEYHKQSSTANRR